MPAVLTLLFSEFGCVFALVFVFRVLTVTSRARIMPDEEGHFSNVRAVLLDIEGTTTSISFVKVSRRNIIGWGHMHRL